MIINDEQFNNLMDGIIDKQQKIYDKKSAEYYSADKELEDRIDILSEMSYNRGFIIAVKMLKKIIPNLENINTKIDGILEDLVKEEKSEKGENSER